MAYSGNIKSTVATYLADGKSNLHFIQNESKSSSFVHEVTFIGNDKQQNGMFSFDESVQLSVSIKKTPGTMVDKDAVAGICIYTDRGLMMCVAEQPLRDLMEVNEVTFNLTYPSGILMPGNYIVQVDLHVPNVCYLDKQETVTFSVFDNGSEFLKYNGANNGVVMLRPTVSKYLQ